jgi:type VI secretion system protein ImpF
VADPADADELRPSLLDRLIGDESEAPRGRHGYVGVRELRAAVARDLEWLLNSKLWYPWDLERFREADHSNLTYGVPDFSVYSWRSPSDAPRIAEAIRDAVDRFEPRLGNVAVEVLPGGDKDDFDLRLRIEAILQVDPVSEPVAFDTEIDFDSTAVQIKGAS